MFVFVLVLAFFQEEDYRQKGYKLMLQASANMDKSSPYYRNSQKIINLRHRAVDIAEKIRFDKKEIEKMAKSEEIIDRVAASYAIALGTISTIDEKLFDLLLDENNIVSISAREAFVYLVNDKLNNFLVDQGPHPSATKNKKYEASVLWRIFLSHHQLTHNKYSKEELSALDDLVIVLKKEWKNKIDRYKDKKQLDLEPQENKQDLDSEEDRKEPFPSDLLDPSTYTVKSIFPKKAQLFRKP